MINKSNKIILASDVDTSDKSIIDNVEEFCLLFNKSRIRKKLKEIRDERKLDTYYESDQTNEDCQKEKIKLSKSEIEEIKSELLNDSISRKIRETKYEEFLIKNENFLEIRNNMGLNQLNEFSSEIERRLLQTKNNFPSFEEIIELSKQNVAIYFKMIEIRKQNILEYCNNYFNGILENNDELDLIIKMKDLYSITKDIDDIELYEKYELETNIDFSNKLADICFKRTAESNYYDNIINNFNAKKNTGIISSLTNKTIISNNLFGILLNTETSFISTNFVTCYQNTYTTDSNNKMIYVQRTLGELLYLITDPEMSNIPKENRQQIYCTYEGSRPSSSDYWKWNGLQIYDIDLKEWSGDINNLKTKLHSFLLDFHWYLWIAISASGKGLHIYTKVTPPHHIYTDVKNNDYISKYWYNINYLHKLSIVYDCLDRLNKIPNNNINFVDEFENKFVDNSVGRITSGIRLTYDNDPLINSNFVDLHPAVGLSQTLDGFENQETINRTLFRITKYNQKMIDRINNELRPEIKEELDKKHSEEIDLSKFNLTGDLSSVNPLPRTNINYITRYNVCNSLASIMGKDGLMIAHKLLDSEKCKNVGEINSFYSCAMQNSKKPSKLGLEILKKAGIIKNISEEIKDEADLSFNNQLKKSIELSLNNILEKANYELKENQYLSDYKKELIDSITGEKINILFSPAGSGKTELVKQLVKDGKRILLCLPFISIIKNKIETDPTITENFDCYYGPKDIKNLEYGRNCVTTFDKFSKSNYEKLSKMFDYIFIDEAHLLFTSGYRIEATSNAVKKLKELFYISSNDPFAAKLVLLTGTPVGEEYFFGNIGNIIKFSKKSHLKNMEFLICSNTLDSITRLAFKASEFLKQGYKLLIPTNKGDIYSEKLIGMINYLLGKPIKYGYYKRSNTEQEICKLINEVNSVGNYDIIFCSNYLSVGVDIVDKCKFASLYFGDFAAFEIEQFNARIRKTGIDSVFCITTETNDGSIQPILLEEPNLVLKITEEDKEHFIDDKEIAKAKQEFIGTYDPILRKVVTPGFSIVNGKFQFNLEEYELLSFENKFSECMQHPIKVARELDKFGYNITVSTEFEGLGETLQEDLKRIGIESAKQEKQRKHDLMIGTFCALIDNNSYTNEYGLEFNNIIDWIGKNTHLIEEDRELEDYMKIEYDVFATPVKVILKSKEAFEKMYKSAKFLIKKYSPSKAIDLMMSFVDTETNLLNFKRFNRSMNLLRLLDSSEAGDLSDQIQKIISKMYDFIDSFSSNQNTRISYDNYRSTIETWTNEYIDSLGIKIKTMYGFEKIQNTLIEILNDLGTKHTSKAGIRYSYNTLPDQNSETILNRRNIDSLVESVFKLNDSIFKENQNQQIKIMKDRHIILSTQMF